VVCPRRDSNPHEPKLIRLASERVYHFRHGGTLPCEEADGSLTLNAYTDYADHAWP
jgi:hypothetical protein